MVSNDLCGLFGVGFFRSFCCLRRKDLTAKVAKVPQRSQRSQAHWDSSPWDSVLVNPPQFCENKSLPTRFRRNQGKELKLVNDSAPLLANHLAQVFLGDLQLENRNAFLLGLLQTGCRWSRSRRKAFRFSSCKSPRKTWAR